MNKVLRLIVLILLVIGGLNWGLVGFFNFDLVAAAFGAMSVASRVVYGIVGIASLVGLVELFTMNDNSM